MSRRGVVCVVGAANGDGVRNRRACVAAVYEDGKLGRHIARSAHDGVISREICSLNIRCVFKAWFGILRVIGNSRKHNQIVSVEFVCSIVVFNRSIHTYVILIDISPPTVVMIQISVAAVPVKESRRLSGMDGSI